MNQPLLARDACISKAATVAAEPRTVEVARCTPARRERRTRRATSAAAGA